MKTQKILLLILLMLGLVTTHAQQIISTGGDYFSNANGSLSITISEPVTETFTGGANILTQGFQQSRLKVLGIDDFPVSEHEISVFPNPVHDHLNIIIGKHKNESFSYKLFDIQGKILESKQFEPPETEILFRQYTPSVYFLRIYAFDTLTGTYKIVKQ